ncbi:MAG: DUF6049 family protein [Aeromicrobium sp.]
MSTYGRRLRLVLLAMVFAMSGLTLRPALAASAKPDLSVRISALSPTQIKPKSTVTMSGTVTNNNTFAWKNVQAYLVIAHVPYTSRSQLDDAISSSTAYTGERVVEPNSFDTMGDLAPGKSFTFRVNVPYDQLKLNGADGVYPVGVQILGTDPSGHRSTDAIARATTFLPMLSKAPKIKVAASIGWPFLMPIYRGTDRTYADGRKLLAAVSPRGQLRNLLDIAGTMTSGHDTVIIDPALLVGVDDLAHRRSLGKKLTLSDGQVAAAKSFLADLLSLARNGSCWIVGYDRPDVLALQQNRDVSGPLNAAVNAATSSAIDTYGLSGRRVSWPTSKGVTPALLQYVRGPGDQPVIVDSGDLKGWTRRDGSLIQYQTAGGPIPLLIDDAIDENVPGRDSVVSLRQRIVSDSALAVLLRSIDPGTKADAIALVPPNWDPGPDWAAGRIDNAFDTPWVDGASFDELLTRPIEAFKGSLPSTASASAITRTQLLAAGDIRSQTALLDAIQSPADAVSGRFDQDTASGVSVRWRKNRETGLAIARAAASSAGKELKKITIEGPESVTLSSSNGKFPLTILNDTSSAIKVGVRLDSSNPALTIPDVPATTVDAGERLTLNVNVDVRDQRSTSVAAQLITPEGKSFGNPVVFQVRSSAVGAVLWVALGAAGILVVIALLRRFTRRRKG